MPQIPSEGMKCPGCGEWRPQSAFYLRNAITGNRYGHCGTCHGEQVMGHPVETWGKDSRATTKPCHGSLHNGALLPIEAFAIKNHKTGLRRSLCQNCKNLDNQKYKETHRDAVRASDAAYRAANAELLRERQRQWARDHPEAYRQIHSRWKQANKELVNAATWRRRYAIEANGGVQITADEWIAVKARYGGHCLMCGNTPASLEYDHVVPASAPHNGPMDVSNGQPLCRSCNSIKHTRVLDKRMVDGAPSPYDLWPDLPIGTVELSRVEQLGQPV